MNNPYSPYIVETGERTVTHKQTGVVMRFEPHSEGGWNGTPDPQTIPPNVTAKFLAGLARRMGDAWADAIRRNGGNKP
jgi:hypothetical protein